MSWTWDDYAKKCAEELGMCRDIDQFKGVVSNIERQLTTWGTDADQREQFWDKLKVAYAKAPKLKLADMTAAEKLFALQQVADKMLAAAQQQSAAFAASKK